MTEGLCKDLISDQPEQSDLRWQTVSDSHVLKDWHYLEWLVTISMTVGHYKDTRTNELGSQTLIHQTKTKEVVVLFTCFQEPPRWRRPFLTIPPSQTICQLQVCSHLNHILATNSILKGVSRNSSSGLLQLHFFLFGSENRESHTKYPVNSELQ